MKRVTVMRVICHASGADSGVDGRYLMSMDWTVEPGGDGRFTKDPVEAMRFADAREAFTYWKKVHPTVPRRPNDGKPNRPLTALTVDIHAIDVPD